MSEEEIRLFEFNKGVEFASNVLNKEITERDQTIKELQDKLLERQKEYAEAITELKSMDEWIKEKDQTIKELRDTLHKTLLHWGKMDNPELYEEDYDFARKLLEL
jgi:seryl-tRNA synthetase